ARGGHRNRRGARAIAAPGQAARGLRARRGRRARGRALQLLLGAERRQEIALRLLEPVQLALLAGEAVLQRAHLGLVLSLRELPERVADLQLLVVEARLLELLLGLRDEDAQLRVFLPGLLARGLGLHLERRLARLVVALDAAVNDGRDLLARRLRLRQPVG